MAVQHPLTTARTVNRIRHEPGQTVVEPIEVGSIIKTTWVRLRAKVKQNSGRSIAPQSFAHFLGLIRRFELKINEQDTVVSLDGVGLYLNAQRDHGINPRGWRELPILTSPDVVNYEVYLPLSHYLPRAVGPLRTALDLRGARNCHVSIEWALNPVNALFRGTLPADDITVEDVQCEVISEFIGNLKEGTPRALIRQLKYKSDPITADDAHWDFNVGRGNGTFLKSIMILTTRDKFATVPERDHRYGDVLDGNLKIGAAEQTFKDAPPEWYLAKEHSNNQYAAPPGVLPIEFADMFDTGQMLNMNELDSDLLLSAPVRGPHEEFPNDAVKISIYTDCVRSPRWDGA